MKERINPAIPARKPRQDRARHKVQLILEAAMRLMDQDGMGSLTTNAVARKAGVSIGTLYQYFPNKEAILDALADQEMTDLSARLLAVLEDESEFSAQQRIHRIVSAVAASYGERRRVHRLVLEHSLSQGTMVHRNNQMIERIITLLTSRIQPTTGQVMDQADAFVLANAFLGVMRAMITRPDASHPTQDQIEQSLGRLIMNSVQGQGAWA